MGYKQHPSVKAESGCIHNPKPSTKRGWRRHEKRDASDKSAAEAVWAGGKPCRKTKAAA